MREAINATFTAVARDEPAERHWPALRVYAAAALQRSVLTADHRLEWPEGADPRAMLWPVAHATAGLLTGPELHRVKRCAGCPWLFMDRSENGSRRWCAMNDCGTHEKITRYVARRAADRTAPT